ncbi:MAG: hypothetical protein AAF657_33180, partial [Acidobacteriota bacterium]
MRKTPHDLRSTAEAALALPLRLEAYAKASPADKPSVEAADPARQRWSRLLTNADKDPESILNDPRSLKPQFLAQFFDLCDGKALEAPWAAPDYAAVALQLAEKTGDIHLVNLAKGVAVHS